MIQWITSFLPKIINTKQLVNHRKLEQLAQLRLRERYSGDGYQRRLENDIANINQPYLEGLKQLPPSNWLSTTLAGRLRLIRRLAAQINMREFWDVVISDGIHLSESLVKLDQYQRNHLPLELKKMEELNKKFGESGSELAKIKEELDLIDSVMDSLDGFRLSPSILEDRILAIGHYYRIADPTLDIYQREESYTKIKKLIEILLKNLSLSIGVLSKPNSNESFNSNVNTISESRLDTAMHNLLLLYCLVSGQQLVDTTTMLAQQTAINFTTAVSSFKIAIDISNTSSGPSYDFGSDSSDSTASSDS